MSKESEIFSDGVARFLADLWQNSSDAANEDEQQKAIQVYLEGLIPWLNPSDLKSEYLTFVVFEDIDFSEDGEFTQVKLSPEGWAFLGAWVKWKKGDPPHQGY